MRIAKVTLIFSVIRVSTFIAFVCVSKAVYCYITLMNTPCNASNLVSVPRLCVTCPRTSQERTALYYSASGGFTACVQALVAAKASLDIKEVSHARLFACPVSLELPGTSKSQKQICVVLCVCFCEQSSRMSRLYLGDCAFHLCLHAHKVDIVICYSRLIISTLGYWGC